MCLDDGDDRVEISADDLARLVGLYRWNTLWTALGAVAGWIALAVVIWVIIPK